MPRSKLPDDAFTYYLSLGKARSHQAVAEHYGVSKKTVSRMAQKEGWAEEIDTIAAAARKEMTEKATETLLEVEERNLDMMIAAQQVFHEVVTPARIKAIVAKLISAAVQKEDVTALRALMDRIYGKPRNHNMPAVSLDLPEGLETASDIRRAANAIVKGLTRGLLSADDAQKAASVIESARKSVETDDLEKRIAEIEEEVKRGRGR